MSGIEIRFECGHQAVVPSTASLANGPQCVECGNTRVTYVKAPRPTFKGVGIAISGPCVEN